MPAAPRLGSMILCALVCLLPNLVRADDPLRWERRVLTEDERYALARQALALRFEPEQRDGLSTAEALQPRRAEDAGSDLWRTYNVLQESVVRGGLVRRLPSGRLTRTRGIRAIREDVRLNAGLWELATSYLEPVAA